MWVCWMGSGSGWLCVVYFRKETGVLAGPWIIGMIDTAIRGLDNHVREVDIRYQNSTENTHRTTRRSARTIVRLFNVDEHSWRERMDAIWKLARDTNLQASTQDDEEPVPESIHLAKPARSRHCCCNCPEPRMLYPGLLNQEEHRTLTHMAWTPEDETLNCGIDRQQQPATDMFMYNIVALGMSLEQEDR